MGKILVDGGTVVNVMVISTFWKLGKGPEDLTTTNMSLKNFEGNTLEVKEVLNMELTISK
jgi:hypothetical protein